MSVKKTLVASVLASTALFGAFSLPAHASIPTTAKLQGRAATTIPGAHDAKDNHEFIVTTKAVTQDLVGKTVTMDLILPRSYTSKNAYFDQETVKVAYYKNNKWLPATYYEGQVAPHDTYASTDVKITQAMVGSPLQVYGYLVKNVTGGMPLTFNEFYWKSDKTSPNGFVQKFVISTSGTIA